MMEKDILVEKEFSAARDLLRTKLADVYDQTYRSFDELHGRSNDEASDPGDDEREPYYPPVTASGSSTPLPYIAPTEFDPETGQFQGLEPPLA